MYILIIVMPFHLSSALSAEFLVITSVADGKTLPSLRDLFKRLKIYPLVLEIFLSPLVL